VFQTLRACAPVEFLSELPIVRAHARSLPETIGFPVENRETRGGDFAATWHNPVRVAARTVATYAECMAFRSD
jgi:hypothetical protein